MEFHTASRPLRSDIAKLRARVRKERECVAAFGRLPAAGGAGAAAASVSNRAFLMRCVKHGCEGFVSTGYKCGLCESKICKDCHVITDGDHACNADVVASIAAVKKESRPCPKCAAPISKIDGCDQIWCTLCKTAFSWNTGKIETGPVHNPHYFQWIRESGQALPRREGDCGFNAGVIQATLGYIPGLTRAHLDWLLKTLQNVAHIRRTLIDYRNRIRDYEDDEWRRELRVQRLTAAIDDAAWKRKLQMREKAYNKEKAWFQLMELYANCAGDLLASLRHDSTMAAVIDVVNQIATLKAYVNKEIVKIVKMFDCVLPLEWQWNIPDELLHTVRRCKAKNDAVFM